MRRAGSSKPGIAFVVGPGVSREMNATPVIGFLPALADLESQFCEGVDWKLVVLDFRFLKREDVDLAAVEPAQDVVQARADGVDIPTREQHDSDAKATMPAPIQIVEGIHAAKEGSDQ